MTNIYVCEKCKDVIGVPQIEKSAEIQTITCVCKGKYKRTKK